MPNEKLTQLQQAMVEHDDEMARLDRNTMPTPETTILDESAVSEIEAQMRVKDFTYYPLMSTVDCAFRVVNQIPANTYHQCSKYARETIEGYGFCLRHAAIVRAATGKANSDD